MKIRQKEIKKKKSEVKSAAFFYLIALVARQPLAGSISVKQNLVHSTVKVFYCIEYLISHNVEHCTQKSGQYFHEEHFVTIFLERMTSVFYYHKFNFSGDSKFTVLISQNNSSMITLLG